jgi:hypothetical protein
MTSATLPSRPPGRPSKTGGDVGVESPRVWKLASPMVVNPTVKTQQQRGDDEISHRCTEPVPEADHDGHEPDNCDERTVERQHTQDECERTYGARQLDAWRPTLRAG